MHVKTIRQKLATFLKVSQLLDIGAKEILGRSIETAGNRRISRCLARDWPRPGENPEARGETMREADLKKEIIYWGATVPRGWTPGKNGG
jgi:hypothetical protein